MAQKQEMTRRSFQSLPTETICSILKIVLESMVEDDMTTTPEMIVLSAWTHCLALRTLYVDKNIACNLDHQWLKNSMQHIEVVIICGGYPINSLASLAISRALQAIPLRIPCLILDDLQFTLPWRKVKPSQSVQRK